jgi:hypothetical protein
MTRKCEDLAAYQQSGESLIEAYRRLQSECRHEARDSRGQCFRCGHREVK